jgi:carbon monoxide dehydrogenase subunit G/phosphoglycerate dehydrogenase-like enzyme
MIFEDSFTIHAPQAVVWAYLNDIPRVSECLLGLQNVEVLSPDEYQGLLKVRVGSVGVAFNGKVTILERSGGSTFAAQVEARDASTASNVSATFTAHLEAEGDDTRIRYTMDLLLRGRLAQYGQAVIQGTARNMTADFARCMQDTLSVTRQIVIWGMDFPDLELESGILAGLDVTLEPLAAEPDEAGWEKLAKAHILLAAPGIELSGEILRRLARCTAIVCYARTASQVYLRVATERGIQVAALGDYDAPQRATHTLDLIMAAVGGQPPTTLTLGLLGWDAVARLVRDRAAAQGFQVLVSDPAGKYPAGKFLGGMLAAETQAGREAGLDPVPDLIPDNELFQRSDVLALFGEVTSQTFQIVNARSLEQARPGVRLVNTGNPRLVDSAALDQALRGGRVSLAALDAPDYFESGLSRSWLESGQLLLMPQAAGLSQEAALEQRRRAAQAAAGFAGRGTPPNLANPEVNRPAETSQPAPTLRWSD